MPGVTLDLSDAAELAETLTFLADWLSGSQEQTLAGSLTAFVGHPAYTPPAPSAPTCTGSSSSSGSATAKTSSASRHHDQQDQARAPHA